MTVKVGPLQPAEPVLGQPAEEGCGLAQPGDGAGDVERATAQPGIKAAVGIHDQVDQGLTRDGDHTLALISHNAAGMRNY